MNGKIKKLRKKFKHKLKTNDLKQISFIFRCK